MTKSTITREESVQAIFDLKVGYRLEFGDIEILKRVARMSLAAMDSEPVAWIAQNKNTGEVEIDEPFAKATNPKYWTDAFPVYRHAQQPVVPEGYKLVPTELTSEMVKAFRSFCEAYDDDLIAGYKAMLAAAQQSPGSEPDTVPGKWIPVSEQMPEDAQWCVVITEYGYYVQCWSDGQGWLGDDISIPNVDVTHWMPLPAAPQEVKP